MTTETNSSGTLFHTCGTAAKKVLIFVILNLLHFYNKTHYINSI